MAISVSNYSTPRAKVQIKKDSLYRPADWDKVKYRREGRDYISIISQRKPTHTHIRRIDANTYKIIRTGEVCHYRKMDKDAKAASRRAALMRTMRELSGLIRTNFVNAGQAGHKAQLFITLTYADNMQDSKRLYDDFRAFWQRFKRAHKEHNLEYISVAEPQGRGAWHLHVMVKSTNKRALYVDNKDVTEIWGYGYTDTQRLKSDDIGTYYVAYFTDLIADAAQLVYAPTPAPSSQEVALTETDVALMGQAHISKSRIKGGRLHMYPDNFKFYRCSKGIIRPQWEPALMLDVTHDARYQEVSAKSYDIITTAPDGTHIDCINSVYHGMYKRKK